MTPNESPRQGTEGQQDEPQSSTSLTDSHTEVKPDTPMISGMLGGKVRPGAKEPDITHYRKRDGDAR